MRCAKTLCVPALAISLLAASALPPPAGAQPEADARRLADVHPGPGSSVVGDLELVQGQAGGQDLLALAPDGVTPQLWGTSGTPEGTAPLLERPLAGFEPLGLAVFATTADAALVRAAGDEVWWVRPGAGPARLLGTMAPTGGSFSWPLGAALGEQVIFRGRDGAGEELWRTDGTVAGTRRFADLVAGSGSAYPGAFVAFADRLAFQARGGGGSVPDEVWSTDGTTEGTRRLLGVPGAFLFPLTGTAERLLFRVLAATPAEEGIWGSNGQAGHATRLLELPLEAVVHTAPLPGRGLLVAVHDVAGTVRLWFTDGTPAGTKLLHEEAVGAETTVALRAPATEVGGVAPRVLMLHEPGTGWRFWSTDGTAAGTTPFLLPLGAEHDQASSPPALLGADGEALYWALADDVVGREPWVTDRHGLGAILVGDLCPEDCSSDPFAPRALAAGGMTFGASVEEDRGLWFTSASAPAAFPLLPPGGLEGSLESTDYGYLGRETTAPSGTEPWAVRLTVPCSENATTLCLNDGRFAVRAAWRSKTDAGQGQVFPLTDDTGAFWFFGPRNLELVVKVLDACKTAFESFWVYASGLTDVEVELTIDDSAGGGTQRYRNELDTPFVLVRDISAFGCE